MKVALFFVALIGVASAARQIVLDAPPPPPITPNTTANVPGVEFAIVVPGFSQATWTPAQTSTLCSGLANLTSGYPTKYLRCEVKFVGNTIAPGYQPISVTSNGFLVWDAFVGMTDSDRTAAANSRELFINTIKNNETLLTNIYAGANLNNTCSSAWTPVLGGNDFTAPLAVDGWASGGTCRMGIRGISAVAGTPPELNLPQVETTVDSVGLDNGKVCATGFIQRAIPLSGGVFAIPPGGRATNAFTCTANTAAKVFTCTLTPTVAGTVRGVMAGSVFELTGSDLDTTPVSPIGSNCDSAAQAALRASLVADTTQIALSPPAVTADVNGANQFTFDVPVLSTGACADGDALEITATPGNMKFNPKWSPACDIDPFFLRKNVPGAANPTWGSVCPLCGNNPANPVPLQYNGPNARKFCNPSPVGQLVIGVPNDVNTAGLLGTSCIGPIGSTSAPNQPFNGYPMLSPGAMAYLDGAPQDYVDFIFPNPTGPVVGSFSKGSVRTYNAAQYQRVALDTEWNTPCSTPRLVGPAVVTQTVGIVGGYELGKVAANPNVGAGSCNTQSMFFNGGKVVAGVDDSYSQALLRAQFIAAIQFPAPAPAPSPAPRPAPSPAPRPAPSPAPTPSPSAPRVCSYTGVYEIIPLYAPCNRYRLASGTDADCDYNLVTLRTAGQVGRGKVARLHWQFATIAEDGLSVPTNVLARARRGCTNRFLAAPSDPTTLKTGGSSWKWQFVPWPGAISCEEVNVISQNRLSTTAFLQVPRSCDRFRYNATDGGRQRFRLRRVNLPV